MNKNIQKLLPKQIKLFTPYALDGKDGKYVFYKDSIKTIVKKINNKQVGKSFTNSMSISESFSYDLPTKIPFQLIQFAYTYFVNTLSKSPYKKFISIYYISNNEIFEANKHKLGNYYVQHGDFIVYIPEKVVNEVNGNVNVLKSVTDKEVLNYLKPSEFGTRMVLNVISFVKSSYITNDNFMTNVFKGNDLLVISDIQPLTDQPFQLEIYSSFTHDNKKYNLNHKPNNYIDLPKLQYDLVSTLNESQYEQVIPFKEYKTSLTHIYLSNKLLPSPHFKNDMIRK